VRIAVTVTSELERLTTTAEHEGLRPIIDPDLEVVLIDCPHCRAQDTDPWGLWRPARIVPRTRRRTILCTACGRRDEQRLR
jgi:hypothetical protein